jgi:ribosome-associated protein
VSAPADRHPAHRERGGGREASEELARLIAGIADEKLGADLVALDVGELVGYTDFLLICTARNERQAKAIHDEVYHRLKHDHGKLPAAVEGEAEGRWVLMDYLDCVLHLFVPELRERYRLDVLWGEAPRLELDVGAPQRSPG